MHDELPLFLLQTVLFPHMQLPLQVFEPRYLELIRDCRARDLPFGVHLIASGEEVGGDAEPVAVGCSARIASCRKTSDGRLLVVAEGKRRHRIEALERSRPYLQARVTLLEDHSGPEDPAMAEEVFRAFRELLGEMGLEIEVDASILAQPGRVSYLVAAHLNRSNRDKQRLLEIDSVARRLRLERRWIRELRATLKERRRLERIVGRNGRIRRKE